MKKRLTPIFSGLTILILIIVLAAVLRLWNISKNPPGLTWDEAALGYNAYSILVTGRDEYGHFLPVNLKSFGDYKPALYAYLDIPFVAILGLNELAVRLPSVLAGIGFVVVLFYFTKQLFKSTALSLCISFMAAISPTAIQFSRAGFESNVALFMNLLAVFCFFKALKNPKFFYFSAIFFSLSLFAYQASRIFIPILLLGLFFVFRKKLTWTRDLAVSLIIFTVCFLLIIHTIFFQGQSGRLAAMNFFAYTRSSEQIEQISKEDGLPQTNTIFQMLHGEWFAYFRGLTERYLIYYSPKMLFIDGDYSPRHRVPDLGVLYYISVLLIPFGMIYIWRLGTDSSRFIFLWMGIATIPAVLSRDLITLVRALNITLPLVILEGVGLFSLFVFLRRLPKLVFFFTVAIMLSAIFLNLIIFLDRYFVHAPIKYSQGWLYGYKEIITYIDSLNLNQYDKVLITDDYGQPYIYYLFYTKYPPEKFQRQVILDQPSVDVGTVRNIDKLEFRHIYWPKDRYINNSLAVATLEELPDKDILPFSHYQILKETQFLDGLPAFRVVKTKL